LKVRPSSYTNKRTGEKVDMVYLDLYDDTASLLQVEMKANGALPVEGTRIVGDVQFLRKIAFGSGVSVVLKSYRGADVPGWVPPSATAPAKK
jgi:hypothetical protein